jgi:hypothetical protein
MEYGILTTRFNNKTYEEYETWKNNNNYNGCIYCLRTHISYYNIYDKDYFVLEMNNDINKVMGIGIIKNIASKNKIKLFSNQYINNYCYKGKRFVKIYENGKSLLDEETYNIFKLLFENILFKGRGHMKRGQSMTHFPHKKMTKEHIDLLLKITS